MNGFKIARRLMLLTAICATAGCHLFADDPPAPTSQAKTVPPTTTSAAPATNASATSGVVPAAATGPVEPFTVVRDRWKQVDAQLAEVGKQFQTSRDPAEREKLFDQYSALAKQSADMLPQLQAAALAEFQAAPNQNEEVTNTLLGIVQNDYKADQYERSLRLARELLAAGCTEPLLPAMAGASAYCCDEYDAAAEYFAKAKELGKLTRDARQCQIDLARRQKLWTIESARRAREAKADDLPRVVLQTSKGDIVIELFENEAPNAVANFINLIEKNFYDGVTFHRVLSGFMAQGGDPKGTGSGGPGYNIPCECYREDYRHHFHGSLSMAHAGKDTGGSQFFLTFRPTPQLDGLHTCFGRVIQGFDALASLQKRNPEDSNPPSPDRIVSAKVLRKRDHVYEPKKIR